MLVHVMEHCNQDVCEPESDGKEISTSERFDVVCYCTVGFSWWGKSATKNTGTQTEPSTVAVEATTNTDDEFPVFGYPTAISKNGLS